MNTDPINTETYINNQQRNPWSVNLKDILDQSKQSIDVNDNSHQTGTLAMTFSKPVEKANNITCLYMAHIQFSIIPR